MDSGHPDPHSSMIVSTVEGQSTAGLAVIATSATTAGNRHTLATVAITTSSSRQPPTVTDTETAAATNPTHAHSLDSFVYIF